MGVDSGYTQKDVTELARMLTGWTYDNRELVKRNRTFAFDSARHDRDDKVWLGRRIKAGGVEGPWTFWDYGMGAFHRGWGLRMDLLLGSPRVAERLVSVEVDRDLLLWTALSRPT